MIKKIGRVSIFIILFLITITSNINAEEVIYISVGEYPPYIEEQSEQYGVMSELVIKAFAMVKIKAILSFLPWKRVELEIDKGTALSFTYVHSKERDAKWLFSESIFTAPTVLIMRKDMDFSWKTFDDLKLYKIGITRGYSYGKKFDQFKHKLQTEIVNSDLLNMNKILYKRIDIFPIDPLTGAMLLKKNFTPEKRKDFKFVFEPPISVDTMHAVCSKNNKKCEYYLSKFNEGLKLITDNGIKQQIIDKSLSLE